MIRFTHAFGLAFGLSILVAPATFATVTFDWATIGHAGNANDPEDGDVFLPGVQNLGAVSNEFRIAIFEVTNTQYAEFLNIVAASDPNGLYDLGMADPNGGIVRSGIDGAYTYAVAAGREDFPVINVSFFEAMRFVNWLHNGQGTGSTESGVYTISDGLSETRDANATYYIPTEDEWYKAAYYQPAADGGDSDDYWLYPTSSNAEPIADVDANIDNPLFTSTPAGNYNANYYGLFDMGGNLDEWNEGIVVTNLRGLRGGSWGLSFQLMQSSNRAGIAPTTKRAVTGIRIASAVLAGDLNSDSVVDTADLGILIGQFGTAGPEGDINGDGIVDTADLGILIAAFGTSRP